MKNRYCGSALEFVFCVLESGCALAAGRACTEMLVVPWGVVGGLLFVLLCVLQVVGFVLC